jgi:histidine triad (HIT) family protein
MNCIFCSIIERKSPAHIQFEDETCLAFNSNRPVAPVHVLIVPKKHIASANDLVAEDEETVGHLFRVAQQLANELGVAQTGYRLIVNTGRDGGQTIFHFHLHLIGGRHLPLNFDLR